MEVGPRAWAWEWNVGDKVETDSGDETEIVCLCMRVRKTDKMESDRECGSKSVKVEELQPIQGPTNSQTAVPLLSKHFSGTPLSMSTVQ